MKTSIRSLCSLPVPTADGEFLAWYSPLGLASLSFPGQSTREQFLQGEASPQIREWHRITTKALANALGGKPVTALPPLDLSAGTTFQQKVWAVLASIAPGKTLTYAQVAAAVGKPEAMRAVGQACGANPIPVLVPCHRVLAANSRIGGFSGGLNWKEQLLQREGVAFRPARAGALV